MPSTYLSKKVINLKPSGIRKFFDIAANMQDVISPCKGSVNLISPPLTPSWKPECARCARGKPITHPITAVWTCAAHWQITLRNYME